MRRVARPINHTPRVLDCIMSPRQRSTGRRGVAKSKRANPETTAGWSPAAARPPIERREALVVGVLFAVAAALRFAYPTRISIEHWDEGVNASNIFLDRGYPFRFLYSPPLVPTLIEWSMLVFGRTAFAAVIPNLMLGSFTILLCWWVGRDWFGPAAGIASAALAALCDFQIVYSRTGLTDAALGFWFLLAVYCSWRALSRNSFGEACLAGLTVACAWATKYNGWLPLAVAVSGFIAWGVFERFGRREWRSRLPVLAVLVAAAAVCWSPVWLSLGGAEGYSQVAANHAQYFFGLRGWWDDFKRQLLNQRYYEGWLTAAGLLLAWLLPAIALRPSGTPPATNPASSASGRREPAGSTEARSNPPAGLTPADQAARMQAASQVLLGQVGAQLHLLTVAGLFAGISLLLGWAGFSLVFAIYFVAFVVFATVLRPRNTEASPEATRARNLAGWLLAAWFLGLLVAIPLYKPYPRLVMPWLVCAWLAAGACIQRVLSGASTRRTARPEAAATPVGVGWQTWAKLVGALAVLALGVFVRMNVATTREILGWQDRTVRATTIKKAAEFARKLAPGKPVFLVYGEPALFFDLFVDGYDPQPPLGGDFAFLGPGQKPLPQPAFLLAYDNIADFNPLIAPYKDKALKLQVIYHDTPSDLVLLDTYSPADLAPGKPRPQQALNLYRILPR
jgi:dolichyl-phosphate-mannose-protein mannosyltransferase